jgi:pyridoxal 5-phosphate dependent beta-lyase
MSVSAWVQDRAPTEQVHLDVAACGRVSEAVLAAEVAHLRLEAELGGYVAEEQAEPQLAAGRAALGAMVGLAGPDVLLTDGGAAAFTALLDAWPLARGARIGTVPSEYGGNARLLRQRAALHDWQLVPLEVDELGRVQAVPADLDLVTLPHVASHRGVVQPVADVLASGVPLLLDVAQALGQTEVPAGAAAYVGTSRKWLCGPRGVGFAMVDPAWAPRLASPPTQAGGLFADLRRFDANETHVAGRVGLALAARTWSPAVVPVLQAAAAAARVLLQDAGGWRVVEPLEEKSGISTLRHPSADPVATRAALLAEGFVLSAVPTSRAGDLAVPVLRVSTAAWVTPGDLEALVGALERCTR